MTQTIEKISCNKCGSEDYKTEQSGQHIKAICNNCNSYIKFISQSDEAVLYFGKFKGMKISVIPDVEYLNWLYKSNVKLQAKVRDAIRNRLNELK